MPTLTQAESALVGPPPTAGAGLVGGVLASIGFIATGASPVAALAPASWPKFLDIASLLLLEQAAGASIGGVKSITWPDFSKEVFGAVDLNALLKDRRDMVKSKWGYGAGSLFAGSVDLGFAQTDPRQTQPLWPWGT